MAHPPFGDIVRAGYLPGCHSRAAQRALNFLSYIIATLACQGRPARRAAGNAFSGRLV
jgi:hypothetical protein